MSTRKKLPDEMKQKSDEASRPKAVKRDKTKVNPLSGAEDTQAPRGLESLPPGESANATNVEIPGTGQVVSDLAGKEQKRVVTT